MLPFPPRQTDLFLIAFCAQAHALHTIRLQDPNGQLLDVLGKALEMCGKRYRESNSDWAARLGGLRDAGRQLLGFKPLGTPVAGPKTAFGDVLEVYILLGMQALGDLDLKLDLGCDALADGEPSRWIVERTYIR